MSRIRQHTLREDNDAAREAFAGLPWSEQPSNLPQQQPTICATRERWERELQAAVEHGKRLGAFGLDAGEYVAGRLDALERQDAV